jgi:hypothetical protein
VDVGGALPQGLQQQRIDHPDHGRLRTAVEQVLGGRQVLHQPGEIGFAREILAHPRHAAIDVVCAGELGGEALRVDRA